MGNVLYVLTGPTAVGKTELALQWAEENGAEIVSFDSLLVYKGMDIGTAKPTREELGRIPHHCIDIVPVNKRFSVKNYEQVAHEAIESILSRGKNVLITGGSGFYLKCFFSPIADAVDVPEAIVHEVLELYHKEGLAGLVEALRERNPSGTGKVELKNPRRVIRALEKCMTTGQEITAMEEAFAGQTSPFDKFEKRVCMLTRSQESLKERVRSRVKQMLQAGLLPEVARLKDQGILDNYSAARSIGYRESLSYLEEPTSLQDLEDLITQNTMQLVKKQKTWFKYQIKVDHTIDLDIEKCPDLDQLFG